MIKITSLKPGGGIRSQKEIDEIIKVISTTLIEAGSVVELVNGYPIRIKSTHPDFPGEVNYIEMSDDCVPQDTLDILPKTLLDGLKTGKYGISTEVRPCPKCGGELSVKKHRFTKKKTIKCKQCDFKMTIPVGTMYLDENDNPYKVVMPDAF